MASTANDADETNANEKEEIDLIDLVNDLQNKLAISGHSLDVSLPQIVVVGCQSAGKSSVLENIVGREFLPRGSNVVTRRPTVVQLHPNSKEEYGVFLHNKDQKFTDFNEIKKEIRDETNRDPGPIGFSSKPISLEIHSPRVLKLTLVDLPGLIKNVVEGQDEKSISDVRDMVLNYIQQPKCLILAVSPANQDIANSDALEIARIVDPNRERTIGVLTKLDLMDEGTDARDILENLKLPLKRGYVGVLNRSQKDIEGGKDIQYILKKEREYFANKDCYKQLAHRMGTPYLQKLLQKTLRTHIKNCLPVVRNEIFQRLSGYKREIKLFENMMGEGSKGKQMYMIKLIQTFIDDINIKLMGHSELVDMKTISAGAHIHYKLYSEVQKNLALNLVPDDQELMLLITNMYGLRNSISVPSLSMDAICRKLIEMYKEPLTRSVQCVNDVLTAAVAESAKLVDKYPTLKNELLYRIRCSINQETESTQDRLKKHIDAEMFYVNIGHPDFDSSVCDPIAPPAGPVKIWDNTESEDDDSSPQALVNKLKKSEQTQQKVKYLTTMVMKYLEIVQKQIGDISIKYIVYFLVKKVLEFIKADLVPTLIDSANIASLTEDCEEDFRRKEEMEATCKCLTEALDAIQSF